MKIALVGNPNCGKTTLFNAYTGSSQYVGNWPGVTVEKKEGSYIHDKSIKFIDLPGIYSLSPYTSEEVVTRDFLLNENPDLIINIIDAVNLERNLYLTSQVLDMNIPTIIALNRMDMVDNSNVTLDVERLSQRLGVEVIPIVATKNIGVDQLMGRVKFSKNNNLIHTSFYDDKFMNLLNKIQTYLPEQLKDKALYHSIKVLERDADSYKKYEYNKYLDKDIKTQISKFCEELDDDGESIVINEKYEAISRILDSVYVKKEIFKLTTSDKIDNIVTNKWLGLPIFFLIMWFVYFISIETVGNWTVGWVESATVWIQEVSRQALVALGASEPVQGLILDGVIGSLFAIFTYVPQLMILFLFLSLLEDSGYMSRVAFIMDKVFRKFGLSGKSFIPMLIGTGCTIPGIMATRTIENEKDRNMTILLTPFVPCGAKVPVFAMFISMVFNRASWVAPVIYLLAFTVIIISGVLLKRTRAFSGEPAPFVMELPPYTLPTFKSVMIHMWERARDFIMKAGSIIFVSNLVLWLLINFNTNLQFVGDHIEGSILAQIGQKLRVLFIPLGFGDNWAAIIASITGLIAKEVVVSTFATVGNVIPIEFTQVSAFAFIVFTIFAAPCFSAISAMKRELNNTKLTLFAIAFQTGVAYILALITNQLGNIIFKGHEATKKITLRYNDMENASELSIVDGHMYGYLILGVIAISLAIIVYKQFISNKE